MPVLPIESLYPGFDNLSPADQVGTLANGIVVYAKEILTALSLAQTIAHANGLAALIASAEAGAAVEGSTMLTKERAAAMMLMQAWFLSEMDTPLANGMSPKMVLYRKWPLPVTGV